MEIGHFLQFFFPLFFFLWEMEGEKKISPGNNSLTPTCSFFRAKEIGGFSLELVDTSHSHVNIWHVGSMHMAALFTNTIQGFQSLLCNSWEYRLCVSLGAEESNSLIHSQRALVWLWWGHESRIKVSRSGSTQYAVFLPKPQRLCLNIELLFFFFPPATNRTSYDKLFLWFLQNVGKLCLGFRCNLQCHLWLKCTCLPPSLTNAFFFKFIFSCVSTFRCKRIHKLTCPTRHSDHGILKKMIVWSSTISSPALPIPIPSQLPFQRLITTPPSALLHFKLHIKTWCLKNKLDFYT